MSWDKWCFSLLLCWMNAYQPVNKPIHIYMKLHNDNETRRWRKVWKQLKVNMTSKRHWPFPHIYTNKTDYLLKILNLYLKFLPDYFLRLFQIIVIIINNISKAFPIKQVVTQCFDLIHVHVLCKWHALFSNFLETRHVPDPVYTLEINTTGYTTLWYWFYPGYLYSLCSYQCSCYT